MYAFEPREAKVRENSVPSAWSNDKMVGLGVIRLKQPAIPIGIAIASSHSNSSNNFIWASWRSIKAGWYDWPSGRFHLTEELWLTNFQKLWAHIHLMFIHGKRLKMSLLLSRILKIKATTSQRYFHVCKKNELQYRYNALDEFLRF